MLFLLLPTLAQAQVQGVVGELYTAAWLSNHSGSLGDLFPTLGEGLFMRYPPPQIPVEKWAVMVQVKALEQETQAEIWRRGYKALGKAKGEIVVSPEFRLSQEGAEQQMLPLGNVSSPTFLRKRPGRAKFSISAIAANPAEWEEQSQQFRASDTILVIQVVAKGKGTLTQPLLIGLNWQE